MPKQTLGERVTEVETTLFGATRNGGGFIGETRDTFEVVRRGIETMGGEVRDLRDSVKDLARRGKGIVKILEVSVPPLIVGILSVLAVMIAK